MSHKILILLAIACVAGAAQAQTADTQANAGATAAVARQAPVDDRNCLTQTGSNLKPAAGKCLGTANGSAYTKEDIDRTGATTLGEALTKLDPSVTVR